MKFKKFIKKGFTLVELVVVIAVVAILAAVSVISYVSINRKANQSADNQLIAEVNLSLKAYEEGGTKKPKTMYEAVHAIEEDGFRVDKFKTRTAGWEYAYSLELNKFLIVDTEGHTVAPSDVDDIEAGKLWKFIDTIDSSTKLGNNAYYLRGTGKIESAVVINTSFDTGERVLTSLTYDNHAAIAGNGKEVLIRTYGADSALTINAPEDVVNHHGTVGSLNIIAVKGSSYHEYGKTAFAQINKGRIVLEQKSEIKHIHVNKKADAQAFDTVVIKDNGAEALPSAITRDQVDISAATPVVTVEPQTGAAETVYVYPHTDAEDTKTGTTEKTSTQNTSVVSALGELVLDNGADPGEKAMSNNDKEEAQAEVVDELAGEEVAEDPNAAKYVARIGTKGYESFMQAYAAVKAGEKIVIVADSFVIDSSIGTAVGTGLNNKVVIESDTTLVIKNTAQIYFGEKGEFVLNGNTLSVIFDSSCDSSKQSGFMNSTLGLAYDGLHPEYAELIFENNTANVFVDFGYLDFSPMGLIYTDQMYFIVGAGSSFANCSYDESMLYHKYVDGVEVENHQYSIHVDKDEYARVFVGPGSASYTWKVYDFNFNETSEYIEIVENHNSWVKIKCNNQKSSDGLNGTWCWLEVTIREKNAKETKYQWAVWAHGDVGGLPGNPSLDFDDDIWG